MIMLKKMKTSQLVRAPLSSLSKMPLPPPPHRIAKILCHKRLQNLLTSNKIPSLIKPIPVQKTNIYNQLGISFVELLIMTLFLTGIAFSTAFLVTRSKTSMKSVSQTGYCPLLAKDVLEQFASFGTRLYGYSYDGSLSHTDGHPKTRPLLIIPDTSASPTGIKDVAGHSRSSINSSKLKFPGIFAQTLQDLSMTISAGSDGDWVNTGVDIIKMHNNKVELGSSIFIVNTVNVLQYLYNSDQTYFTGKRQGSTTEIWGKMWSTMDSNSALEKYKKQFDLTDLNVYLLIRPVEMGTGQHNILTTEADVQTKCQKATAIGSTLNATSYTCPKDGSHYLLLTRPRLSTDIIRKIPHYVVLHGNPNLGFELKVTLEYQKPDSSESLYCDAMQIFTHQMDSIDELEAPSVPSLESLVNAAPTPVNLMTKQNTSCDTDGTGYDDITLELNLGTLASASKERGTLLMCQGLRACLSGDSLQDYPGTSCTYEAGPWSRCHQVKFPGQTTTTKASLANNKLKLTFENLPANRRYDLNIAEMSMAGTMSFQKFAARFYIDAKRPEMSISQLDDDVGGPLDNRKDRNYNAYHKDSPGVSWNIPNNVFNNQWLQCNQNDVDFKSTVTDQFTHNLRTCKGTASRRDGRGTTNQTSHLNMTGKCDGTLSNIKHGRQSITLAAKDSCGKGVDKDIVWDTDLPSTFAPQDFSNNPVWFKNSKSPSYTINAVLPAKDEGTFPKHYSVDCFEKYWNPIGGSTRPDGHDSTIECSLTTARTDIEDGCNPNKMGIDYWHVCGGSKENKETNWGVYAPYGESCQNVPCEPDLICCDGDVGGGQSHPCGSSGTKGKCAKTVSNTLCTNPKGGDNSQQDSSSNCPPLGLYSCNYTLPCTITESSVTVTDSTVCNGGRQGDSCSFSRTGTCQPNNSNDRSSTPGGFSGTCYLGTLSSGQSCTPDDTCHSQNTESIEIGVCDSDPTDCTKGAKDTCKSGAFESWTGTNSTYHQWYCKNVPYKASDSYPQRALCQRQKSCSGNGTATLNPTKTTDDLKTCTEYKPTAKPCTISFSSGTCGTPTGGCFKKTNKSSGNSTVDICEVNTSNRTRMPASSARVDGSCGSNKHTCIQGVVGTTSESSTRWGWTCSGSNGGSSVSCSKAKSCPQPKYPTESSCQAGLSPNQKCIASPSTIQPSVTCWERNNSPICDTSMQDNCIQGAMTDLLDDVCTSDVTQQCHKWSCRHNTQTKTCELPKKGPGCGTGCLTCHPGTVDDSAVADTHTHVKWRCSHNGQDIDTCESEKTTCDICDNSKKLGCKSGVADDLAVPDTATHIKWRCMGKGQNADTCQCEKGVCDNNGICDSTKVGECQSSKKAIKTKLQNGRWTWTCPGINSGTDANCIKCLKDYQLNNTGTDCVLIPSDNVNCSCGLDLSAPCPIGNEKAWPCSLTHKHQLSNGYYTWGCGNVDHRYRARAAYCSNQPGHDCSCGSRGTCKGTSCQSTQFKKVNDKYVWKCEAYYDNNIDATCEESLSSHHRCGCGSFKYTCTDGCYPSYNAGQSQWTCKHAKYGDSPLCSATKSPAPQCSCGADFVDTCGDECAVHHTPSDTATHDQWTCKKDNYKDSPTCSRVIPLCKCGSDYENAFYACRTGNRQGLHYTATHAVWTCAKDNNNRWGRDNNCIDQSCSVPKKRCGCGSLIREYTCGGSCSADSNSKHYDSINDKYTWICKGPLTDPDAYLDSSCEYYNDP